MVIFSHIVEEISTDCEKYADSYKIIFKNKERIVKLAFNWPNISDEAVAERKESLLNTMYKFR